jgi:hypothetical protein
MSATLGIRGTVKQSQPTGEVYWEKLLHSDSVDVRDLPRRQLGVGGGLVQDGEKPAREILRLRFGPLQARVPRREEDAQRHGECGWRAGLEHALKAMLWKDKR